MFKKMLARLREFTTGLGFTQPSRHFLDNPVLLLLIKFKKYDNFILTWGNAALEIGTKPVSMVNNERLQ